MGLALSPLSAVRASIYAVRLACTITAGAEVLFRRLPRFLIALSFVVVPKATVQAIPSFPGADGAAANVSGGRGGMVYHVTRLDQNYNDASPGTLRYGLNNNNFPAGVGRTIVFDVAGTFWLGRFGAEEGHDNGWDTSSRLNLASNVTIAGQTAPGPVYIMGGLVKAASNNTILRNVSIAPGYGMRSFEKPDEDPPEIPFGGSATQTRDFPDSYLYDAIDITGTNMLIDHVSTFFASDETISANELANNVTIQYSNISQGLNYPQADAEGSGISYTGHALGSLMSGGSNGAFSVHHNLYAHQKGRLPRVGTEAGALTIPGVGAYNDFRNNVFYNWLGTAGGGAGGQPSNTNFVNNFYLAGPGGDDVRQQNGPNGIPDDGDDVVTIVNSAGGTAVFSGSDSTNTKVHHSGNVRDSNKDGDPNEPIVLTNSAFTSSNIQGSPLWSPNTGPTYNGVTDAAADAFTRVLKYMGANWWTRDYNHLAGNTAAIDTVDERLIHETFTGTGKIIAWNDDPFNDYPLPPPGYDAYNPSEGAEWRSLLALRADTVTGAAPFNRDSNWDTDQDGMPNSWEEQHGLNAAVAENNGDFDSDGYTNIEEYINEIAAWPAAGPIVFDGATNARYAQIANWDANPNATTVHNWQPSRYDTAVINSGAVAVDAVGQHAGNLLLATNPGNSATLNITSGWIIVEDAPHGLSDGLIVIGDDPAATATLNLSGGRLITKTLLMGPGGEFNFTGGVLSAQTINFTLENNGGTLAPGSSPGSTTINGGLTIHSGALEIELANKASFDSVAVTGPAALAGNLNVKLLGGYVPDVDDDFTILTGNTITGSFANLDPNSRVNILGTDGSFLVTISDNQVVLSDFLLTPPILPGDFNDDGVVDVADYVAWQKLVDTDTTLPNETASPNEVDELDYGAWSGNFGASDGGANAASAPEPSSTMLLMLACTVMAGKYRALRGAAARHVRLPSALTGLLHLAAAGRLPQFEALAKAVQVVGTNRLGTQVGRAASHDRYAQLVATTQRG
jgi:hypothetical protein